MRAFLRPRRPSWKTRRAVDGAEQASGRKSSPRWPSKRDLGAVDVVHRGLQRGTNWSVRLKSEVAAVSRMPNSSCAYESWPVSRAVAGMVTSQLAGRLPHPGQAAGDTREIAFRVQVVGGLAAGDAGVEAAGPARLVAGVDSSTSRAPEAVLAGTRRGCRGPEPEFRIAAAACCPALSPNARDVCWAASARPTRAVVLPVKSRCSPGSRRASNWTVAVPAGQLPSVYWVTTPMLTAAIHRVRPLSRFFACPADVAAVETLQVAVGAGGVHQRTGDPFDGGPVQAE